MNTLDATPFPLSAAAAAGAAVAVFLLAAILFWLGRRFIHRSVATLGWVTAEHRAILHTRTRQLVTAIAVLAFGVASLAVISVILPRLGFGLPSWTPVQVAEWALSHGVHMLIIVVGAYIALRLANLAIDTFKLRVAGSGTGIAALDRRRRAATLGSIVSSLATAMVFFIAVLMLLRELAIDVIPLLTGAGIAGLAIGFGAQNLVRDVISGFFMILEDQVGVGDVARIQAVTGVVEEVKLRTIVLRDADGAVHVFPNGTISTLANLSKEFAYAVSDVVVPTDENLDRVMNALRMIGAGMQEDAGFSPMLLGPLEVLGVQELREASLTIRTRFKTVPMKQFLVAAELRRRVAIGLAARGIRPFKQG